MITRLPERIAGLPAHLRAACERIFLIEIARGHTIAPATMEPWIAQHFGDPAAAQDQTIIKITNRLTLEATLINPLRARRPAMISSDDATLEAEIARELASHDIFANPERDTTADLFGRIQGHFCISASNVAKYDGWHGLVIFDQPHPLRFGNPQVRDYLDVAIRWLVAAHSHDPGAIYPIITWNCLPKSGATIMHGHMQIALARGMHYAQVERWRRAAHAYRIQYDADYFNDLADIHTALGLALPSSGAERIFAHLTPIRNREIVLLAPLETTSTITNSPAIMVLADALYSVLRRLIDNQGMRAFNLAIALPPCGPPAEDWHGFPVIARLADRGAPLTGRNDWGAMELFGSGCVTVDPFSVVADSL